MFFGSVVVISILLALLTRGPLARAVERPFHRIWLLWLAIGLHMLSVPESLAALLSEAPIPGLPPAGSLIYILSLLLLAGFAWENRQMLGVAVIGAGLLMNVVVIASNGGHMPVDPAVLASESDLSELSAGDQAALWSTWSAIGPETRLPFLGDWIPFPMPLRAPVILSPGDLVIAAGIAAFFLWVPEARITPVRGTRPTPEAHITPVIGARASPAGQQGG